MKFLNNVIEGEGAIASGKGSHAEGCNTSASGDYAHAEGYYTQATHIYAHAEGYNSQADGDYAHAEGNNTYASSYSHSECDNTNASGGCSHAEGSGTYSWGNFSHVEGYYSQSNGEGSHAEGSQTMATGSFSHTEGNSTTANVYASHVGGQFNKVLSGNDTAYSGTADAFVIGNGSSSSALSNAFRVTFAGKVYGLSAYNSTGADYAEFFEWEDGNSNNEDRVGYFVTLDGEKIKLANSPSDYILGIVSVNPSVIGDNYSENWNGKYITDKWGRIEYESIEVPAFEKLPAHTDYVPKINPSWDSSQTYIPREQRKEWAVIGMMGKLLVRDDGTCKVNGFCQPINGIATNSETGYRVLARIDENCVKILLK